MSTTPPTMRPAPTIRRSPAGCSSKPTRPKWSRTREATTAAVTTMPMKGPAPISRATQSCEASTDAPSSPPTQPHHGTRPHLPGFGPGEVARGGADREEARGADAEDDQRREEGLPEGLVQRRVRARLDGVEHAGHRGEHVEVPHRPILRRGGAVSPSPRRAAPRCPRRRGVASLAAIDRPRAPRRPQVPPPPGGRQISPPVPPRG